MAHRQQTVDVPSGSRKKYRPYQRSISSKRHRVSTTIRMLERIPLEDLNPAEKKKFNQTLLHLAYEQSFSELESGRNYRSKQAGVPVPLFQSSYQSPTNTSVEGSLRLEVEHLQTLVAGLSTQLKEIISSAADTKRALLALQNKQNIPVPECAHANIALPSAPTAASTSAPLAASSSTPTPSAAATAPVGPNRAHANTTQSSASTADSTFTPTAVPTSTPTTPTPTAAAVATTSAADTTTTPSAEVAAPEIGPSAAAPATTPAGAATNTGVSAGKRPAGDTAHADAFQQPKKFTGMRPSLPAHQPLAVKNPFACLAVINRKRNRQEITPSPEPLPNPAAVALAGATVAAVAAATAATAAATKATAAAPTSAPTAAFVSTPTAASTSTPATFKAAAAAIAVSATAAAVATSAAIGYAATTAATVAHISAAAAVAGAKDKVKMPPPPAPAVAPTPTPPVSE